LAKSLKCLKNAILVTSIPPPVYAIGGRRLKIAVMAANSYREHLPLGTYTAITNHLKLIKL